MAERPVVILLVEDHQPDRVMTKRVFKKSRIPNLVYEAVDGVDAMRFLHHEAPHQDKPRPDLILLDLNMPRMNGRDVLRAVKSDPNLKTIPIIVLTSSEAEEDIVESYGYHANAYIVKPVTFEEFHKALMMLQDFWMDLTHLPKP